jgi:hypothetical protein
MASQAINHSKFIFSWLFDVYKLYIHTLINKFIRAEGGFKAELDKVTIIKDYEDKTNTLFLLKLMKYYHL